MKKNVFSILSCIVCITLLSSSISMAQSISWNKVSNSGGAFISAFVETGDDVFLASSFNGLLKSENAGASWAQVDGDIKNAEIWALKKSADSRLWAGTKDGLFRSTDEGDSWVLVDTQPQFKHVVSVEFDTADHIFVVADAGVFHSLDDGLSWMPAVSGLGEAAGEASRIVAGENGALFIATASNGVYRLLASGDTWEAVNNGLTNLHIRSLFTGTGSTLLAGTPDGEVFRSDNQGDTWIAINSGLPAVDVRALLMDQGKIYVGAASGAEEGVDGAIYRSDDNGATWVKENIGGVRAEFNALVKSSSGKLLAGTRGSAIYSKEAAQEAWDEHRMGLSNEIVWALKATSNGDVYAGMFNDGLYKTSDNGNSWEFVNSAFAGVSVDVIGESPEGYIAVSTRDDMQLSKDNGISWQSIAGNLTIQEGEVQEIGFTNTGAILVGVYDGVLYRSEDEGESWHSNHLTIPNGPGFGCSGNVRHFATTPNGYVYAGTFCGGLHRSTDDGVTWEKVNFGINHLDVDALVATPAGELFVAANNRTFLYDEERFTNDMRILRSTDNGENWTDLTFDLPDDVSRISAIAPAPVNNDLYLIAHHGEDNRVRSVYQLATNASVWEDLPVVGSELAELAFSVDGYLFMSTYNDGIYRSQESLITSASVAIDDGQETPTSFSLAQNYPNPFNPSTSITYRLGSNTTVRLAVYDLLGREIEVMVDGIQTAGPYEVIFDASRLSSGFYMYRLETSDGNQSRVMSLLK